MPRLGSMIDHSIMTAVRSAFDQFDLVGGGGVRTGYVGVDRGV